MKAENRNPNTPESNRQALVTQADTFGSAVTSVGCCDVCVGRGDSKHSAWVSLSVSLFLPLPRHIDGSSCALVRHFVYVLTIILLSVCAVILCFFSSDRCAS